MGPSYPRSSNDDVTKGVQPALLFVHTSISLSQDSRPVRSTGRRDGAGLYCCCNVAHAAQLKKRNRKGGIWEMCPNKRYRGECDREEKQGAERGRNQQKNRPMLNRKTRRIRRKIRGSTSARKQSKIERSSLSPSVSPLCSCPFIPSLNSAGQWLRDSSVGYPYFTLVHAQYGEHTSVYSYTRRRSNVHSAQAIQPRMAILSCFAYKAPRCRRRCYRRGRCWHHHCGRHCHRRRLRPQHYPFLSLGPSENLISYSAFSSVSVTVIYISCSFPRFTFFNVFACRSHLCHHLNFVTKNYNRYELNRLESFSCIALL